MREKVRRVSIRTQIDGGIEATSKGEDGYQKFMKSHQSQCDDKWRPDQIKLQVFRDERKFCLFGRGGSKILVVHCTVGTVPISSAAYG